MYGRCAGFGKEGAGAYKWSKLLKDGVYFRILDYRRVFNSVFLKRESGGMFSCDIFNSFININ